MLARRLLVVAALSLASLLGASLISPAAFAEALCPNAASRQGPSGVLPDCRVYEQVTPVDKGDSSDLFGNINQEENTKVATSEDGEHLLLISEAAFPVGGDAFFSGYVFSRGIGNWGTTSLSRGPGVYSAEPGVFDPEDLSVVGMKNVLRKALFGGEEDTSFDVGPPGGPYTTLPPGVQQGASESSASPPTRPAGASADLGKIILESREHDLAPGDAAQNEGTEALYEDASGHLQLTNVATDGSLISQCGATLGMAGQENVYDVMNSAVATDGARVVFTAPEPEGARSGPGCWNGWSRLLTQEENEAAQENAPQLYMRVNGSATVEVSAPNDNVHPSGPAQPAVFVGASANDAKVFFISKAQLTADDTGHANELYEYDVEAPVGERLVRVSRGGPGAAEGKVDFVGAVSSDGSAVYFSASGKLTEAAPPEGGLYRYDTVTGKTTYIVSSPLYPFYKGDEQFFAAGWYGSYLGGGEISSGRKGENPVPEQVALMRNALWKVTGDGRFLVFPVDTEGREELFRYSAADGSLACVSCANGVVAEPHENTGGSSGSGGAANFGNGFPATPAPPIRGMSEDGSSVFFQTYTALVPGTTSEHQHVYEWHDGKVSLISSQDDPSNAYFLGMSADGTDVFIGTHAQLGPEDTDQSGDIYDARVDGGFVGITPSRCTGTGCQGVPAAPPIFATPASVTFEGVGDFPPGSQGPSARTVKPRPKPARCRHGLVKRRGRCVRKRAAKTKRARKSATRRGR